MSIRGQENAGVARCIRPVAVSILIGAVSCAALLLVMSVLMSKLSVPQAAVDPMAQFALAAGGFAAGFCCAKIMKEKGLAYGALCGALLSLVMLLVGFAMEDNSFGVPALLKIAFILLSAMLGGVLGVNTKSRRNKR